MKKIKNIILFIATTISVIIFISIFWRAFFYIPSDEIAMPETYKQMIDQVEGNKVITVNKEKTKELVFLSYPKELRIPAINVNSRVQYVGITNKGNIATPNNFSDVGWFKYGILPGKRGSAIISGHVDNGLALPAVFKRLDELNAGDNIYIDTVGGETLHFVVKDFQVYDFNSSTEEMFSQNNGKFLKLITCTGVWVDLYKTHNKRLVVTAELI